MPSAGETRTEPCSRDAGREYDLQKEQVVGVGLAEGRGMGKVDSGLEKPNVMIDGKALVGSATLFEVRDD